MRCFCDAQHDTISDRRDLYGTENQGWRSLPIVESMVFARCAFGVGVSAVRVRRICVAFAAHSGACKICPERRANYRNPCQRRWCSLLTYSAT
jgi:hypothetical protein